jgi:hypothetical protein
MADPAHAPSLFMGLDASVEFVPRMNAEELKTELSTIAQQLHPKPDPGVCDFEGSPDLVRRSTTGRSTFVASVRSHAVAGMKKSPADEA